MSMMADRPSRRTAISALLAGAVAPVLGAAPGGAAAMPLDLDMVRTMETEALSHSHVKEYATQILDAFGPRLTGSPASRGAHEWARDAFQRMGLANPRTERWGEYGLDWSDLDTHARVIAPRPAPLTVAAAPWSPATNGVLKAKMVPVYAAKVADLAPFAGKLAGAIVLWGRPRPMIAPPPSHKLGDDELKALEADGPAGNPDPGAPNDAARAQRGALAAAAAAFFKQQGAVAIALSGQRLDGVGGADAMVVDSLSEMGIDAFRPQNAQPLPVMVMATGSFGLVYRLLARAIPVELEFAIATQAGGGSAPGLNTLAEIPGTDPAVKDEIVMIGGHMDSWGTGTGALDSGASVIAAVEAIRILRGLKIRPRRTIAVGLWGGEDQGPSGSDAFVKAYLASRSQPPGAPGANPFAGRKIVAYFDADGGSGKIRGVYAMHDPAAMAVLRRWIAPLARLGVTTISPRRPAGRDIAPFDRAGIPAFPFIQDPLDYPVLRHSRADVSEQLDFDTLSQMAIVQAVLLYYAAQRDEALR